MNKIQKELEQLCKEIDFPTIEYIGNGLYRFPDGLICGEAFLEELDKAIRKQTNEKP